jgi:hypothetical protein
MDIPSAEDGYSDDGGMSVIAEHEGSCSSLGLSMNWPPFFIFKIFFYWRIKLKYNYLRAFYILGRDFIWYC